MKSVRAVRKKVSGRPDDLRGLTLPGAPRGLTPLGAPRGLTLPDALRGLTLLGALRGLTLPDALRGLTLLGAVCGLGCDAEPERAAAPDTQPPAVQITSPLPGATVVDSVAVMVAATDAAGVARVTLLVDGAAHATRYAAPWALAWNTSMCADSSRHVLQAEAVDPAGNLAVSESITVRVLLNQPPNVAIHWPPDRLWLAVDRPNRPWRCRAWDPDEGPLAADAITWRLDGATIGAGRLELDPPPLAPGDHRLAVIAHDRWGRVCTQTQQLTAFADPGRASPEAAWTSFLCALRARTPQEAAACMAEGFELHAPEQGRSADALRAPEVGRALAAIVGDSLLGVFTVECRTGPVEVFEVRGSRLAKIDLRGLCLTARYLAAGRGTSGSLASTGQSFQISGSAARVYLRAQANPTSPGGESWSLCTWWDLHGSTWASGGGPSLTWLLLESLKRGCTGLPTSG